MDKPQCDTPPGTGPPYPAPPGPLPGPIGPPAPYEYILYEREEGSDIILEPKEHQIALVEGRELYALAYSSTELLLDHDLTRLKLSGV